MERNKEGLTQGLQRRRNSRDSSPTPHVAGESFGKPRRPLEVNRRRPTMPAVAWWSLGFLGVIAITILAWLVGQSGAKRAVSMSALETTESGETLLSADLRASVSASEDLRKNLVAAIDLVAKLEARLAKMDASLDSSTPSGTLTTGDSDVVISSHQENTSSGKPRKNRHENPVAVVQSRLVDLGYDPGPVDGSWGEKTCEALKTYQKDKRAPMGCDAENRTVAEVQSLLVELGYKPGAIDGNWGKKTCNALQAYQRDNGLPVSCRADNRTVAAFGIR
jgi:hypothetical protein